MYQDRWVVRSTHGKLSRLGFIILHPTPLHNIVDYVICHPLLWSCPYQLPGRRGSFGHRKIHIAMTGPRLDSSPCRRTSILCHIIVPISEDTSLTFISRVLPSVWTHGSQSEAWSIAKISPPHCHLVEEILSSGHSILAQNPHNRPEWLYVLSLFIVSFLFHVRTLYTINMSGNRCDQCRESLWSMPRIAVINAGNRCDQCRESLWSMPGIAVINAGNRCDQCRESLWSMPGIAVINAGNRCDQCRESLWSMPGIAVINAGNRCDQCRESLWSMPGIAVINAESHRWNE